MLAAKVRENQIDVWEAQPPKSLSFEAGIDNRLRALEDDAVITEQKAPSGVLMVSDEAQTLDTRLRLLTRGRLVIFAIGAALCFGAAVHFAVDGRIVFIVPAMAMAMYFLLELAGSYQERRHDATSVRDHTDASNFVHLASARVARQLRVLRTSTR